jgi:hypothetical protein
MSSSGRKCRLSAFFAPPTILCALSSSRSVSLRFTGQILYTLPPTS